MVILPVDVLDEKLEELATRLEDRLRGSPVEQDETLTAKEAREILHISSKQFYLLRKEGRIQYFQSGRKILVYRSEIDRYINSHSYNTI